MTEERRDPEDGMTDKEAMAAYLRVMEKKTEVRHHTDAEYDELKAKLDYVNMALLICAESNEKLRAELVRLKEGDKP